MTPARFTVRIVKGNPHREGTQAWRAGLIVAGMEGRETEEIVSALTAFEKIRAVGVQDPSRWLTHFAGLESAEAGKKIEPWIEIFHNGSALRSRSEFREIRAKLARTAV